MASLCELTRYIDGVLENSKKFKDNFTQEEASSVEGAQNEQLLGKGLLPLGNFEIKQESARKFEFSSPVRYDRPILQETQSKNSAKLSLVQTHHQRGRSVSHYTYSNASKQSRKKSLLQDILGAQDSNQKAPGNFLTMYDIEIDPFTGNKENHGITKTYSRQGTPAKYSEPRGRSLAGGRAHGPQKNSNAKRKGPAGKPDVKFALESKIHLLEEKVCKEDVILRKLDLRYGDSMRQQETLAKENFWLRDKISNLSTKISTKVSTQNADLSSNQNQVKHQRETFQVTKNAIDVDCDEILREMLLDYTRNEQIMKSNISHLNSEIDAKKSTIKSIKSQFESLGINLRSRLHSTEQEIRQEETLKHHDRQQNLTLSLKSNQTQISEQKDSNNTLKSQIAQQKTFNKRKFSLFSGECRNFKAS
jgi:hypothetical protein